MYIFLNMTTGLIYVVGGKDDNGRALHSLERYDPRQVT